MSKRTKFPAPVFTTAVFTTAVFTGRSLLTGSLSKLLRSLITLGTCLTMFASGSALASTQIQFIDNDTVQAVQINLQVTLKSGQLRPLVENRHVSVQYGQQQFDATSTLLRSTATGNRELFRNVLIEQRAGQVTLIGRRAFQMRLHNSGHLQKVYVQEFRITLPRSAASGGWDVRSLERELERLGVKVKPKPSSPKPTLPKPTMQLSG